MFVSERSSCAFWKSSFRLIKYLLIYYDYYRQSIIISKGSMEAISNRFSSLKSSVSNYVSPQIEEAPQKLSMRYFRTRMSTVDDIIKQHSDPHELVLGLDRVSDLLTTQRLQTDYLRKEATAEINNIRQCMAKLDEEQRMQAQRIRGPVPADRSLRFTQTKISSEDCSNSSAEMWTSATMKQNLVAMCPWTQTIKTLKT
jgi:hypothetical protein